MRNVKYKIDDKVVILSPEEHAQVNRAIEEGGGVCILREGLLVINTKFIRYSNETDEPTEAELEERLKRLSLPMPEEKRDTEFLPKHHNEFYAKMGWVHKDSCICKSPKGQQT